MENKNYWFFLFLIFFIVLYFDAVKVHFGLTLRIAQLFILGTFFLILLNDLKNKTLNIPLFLFLFGSGITLSLISKNSVYEKIGEFKFIIKYVILFPASFYIGYKVFFLVNVKQFLKIIETSAFVHSLLALIFFFYPVSFLMHNRGALTGYQGTFWESTGLGAIIGLFLLISITLRYDFKIKFKRKLTAIFFYIFLLYTIVMTKSKTFWTGLIAILIYIIISKPIFLIFNYKNLGEMHFIKKLSNKIPPILKLRTTIITLIFIALVVSFFILNSILTPPIITSEMIAEKLQHERGKAFIVAIDLLSKSNWLGGYGWGFIEAYFSTHSLDIIGLGEGISMIFNSYLNEWISVGILGLLFHLTLVVLAFSNKYLFTTVVPLYLFIEANFHPVVGAEDYYIYLGLSYGFKKMMELNGENG